MTAVNGSRADLGWSISVLTRAFKEITAPVVADLPGGPRGFLVLDAVAQGAPRSQLALAQQLGVDKTAMTYLIDELEAARLVERRSDSTDRRARQVIVTPHGTSTLQELRLRLQTVEQKLLAPLDAAEAIAFRDLLDRIVQAARAGSDGCSVSDVAVVANGLDDDAPC